MAKTKDKTAKIRVANLDVRRRESGLVPVSMKIWVPAQAEEAARKILQAAKLQIEKKYKK